MNQKILAFGLLTALTFFSSVNLKAEESIQVEQTTVSIPKKSVLKMNMRLTEQESGPFWKVYGDYEVALDQIHQRMEDLIASYADQYETLTDAQAEKLIQDYFAIQKDEIALRENYIPTFKSVLSARQVARLYQIENKFDAIIRFGLVDQIPLVNTEVNEISASAQAAESVEGGV